MTIRRAKFAPQQPCAILQRAYAGIYDAVEVQPFRRVGDVAIVEVRGPLMHHSERYSCFDSYDAIKARVLEAIEGKPSAIVLSIDSPGGLVSGCFDTTDEIRNACAEAGVKLYAYVDGQATSAAYALACAGEAIVVPSTGVVGSIGVVSELLDVTAQDAAFGVKVTIVASGDRKTDGNPHAPMSASGEAAIRAQVMQLAETFFEHVALARPTTVDEVRALQAAVVTGAASVPTLADAVMSLDEMIEAISSGSFGSAAGAEGSGTDMPISAKGKMSDTLAELHKMAESDDEKESARAKRMIKAYLDDEAKAADPDEDEGKPSGEAPPPPAPAKDKPDDEAKAIASKALAVAESNKAEIASDRAKAAAEQKIKDDAERVALLASRPDFDDATRALCASSSLEDLRAFVKSAQRRTGKAAAGAVVAGVRAAGMGEEAPGAHSEHKDAIDQAMGIQSKPVAPSFVSNGARHVASYPAMTRGERIVWLAKREADRVAKEKAAIAA